MPGLYHPAKIGPNSKRIGPSPEVDRLHQMHQWLSVNGEAIYNTQPSRLNHTNARGRVLMGV